MRAWFCGLFVIACVASQDFSPVLVPRAGERIVPMAPPRRGFAIGEDGVLWALLRRSQIERGPSLPVPKSELVLVRSADGQTWTELGTVGVNGYAGELCVDRGRVYVAFHAHNPGTGFLDAFVTSYDVRRDRWAGRPDRILAASSKADEYVIQGLARSRDGELCVLASGGAQPRRQGFVGSYGASLLVRDVAGDWLLPEPLPAPAGQPQMSCVGQTVHVAAVAWCRDGFGVELRRYDLDDAATYQRQVVQAPRGELEAANCLRILESGGWLYLVYGIASQEPGRGSIRLATRRLGDPKARWSRAELWRAPRLVSRDRGERTLGLARGPGDTVLVMFRPEERGDLELMTLADGRVMGESQRLRTKPARLRWTGPIVMTRSREARLPLCFLAAGQDGSTKFVSRELPLTGVWRRE